MSLETIKYSVDMSPSSRSYMTLFSGLSVSVDRANETSGGRTLRPVLMSVGDVEMLPGERSQLGVIMDANR